MVPGGWVNFLPARFSYREKPMPKTPIDALSRYDRKYTGDSLMRAFGHNHVNTHRQYSTAAVENRTVDT